MLHGFDQIVIPHGDLKGVPGDSRGPGQGFYGEENLVLARRRQIDGKLEAVFST